MSARAAEIQPSPAPAPARPPGMTLPDDLIALVVHCGDQRFGLPIEHVFTVFTVAGLTPVPLAPPEIAGLVNLRGAIVPAVDLATRLRMDGRAQTSTTAVGLCLGTENFALLVDRVGDVVELAATQIAPPLPHISPLYVSLTGRIYRFEGSILPILDVAALLSPDGATNKSHPSRKDSQ